MTSKTPIFCCVRTEDIKTDLRIYFVLFCFVSHCLTNDIQISKYSLCIQCVCVRVHLFALEFDREREEKKTLCFDAFA